MLRIWLLLLAGMVAIPAQAQLRVGLRTKETNRSKFMMYEAAQVIVSIENVSAQDYVFRSTDQRSWLDFIITREDGRTAGREYVQLHDPVLLRPTEVRNYMVNLTPLFMMRQPGRYRVQAVLKPEGKPQVISKGLSIYLDHGRVIWQKQRPLGDQSLTYSLISFSPNPNRTRLYLRVENLKENRVLSTQNLGSYTKVVTPTVFFDDRDQVHILHTIGMGAYGYNRVTGTGKVMTREVFESDQENPPRLRKQADGSVLVHGGFREGRDDRPTLKESQGLSDDQIPEENITNLRSGRARPVNDSSQLSTQNQDSDESALPEAEAASGGGSLSDDQEAESDAAPAPQANNNSSSAARQGSKGR